MFFLIPHTSLNTYLPNPILSFPIFRFLPFPNQLLLQTDPSANFAYQAATLDLHYSQSHHDQVHINMDRWLNGRPQNKKQVPELDNTGLRQEIMDFSGEEESGCVV